MHECRPRFSMPFPAARSASITTRQRRRGRIIGLIFCLLLFGPSLYWGYQRWNERRPARRPARAWRHGRRDLDADGSCTSRRSRLSGSETPDRAATMTLTYRLRPEEGGGEPPGAGASGRRLAQLFTPSRLLRSRRTHPRVMLKPEMDRDMTWSESARPALAPAPAARLPALVVATGRRGPRQSGGQPDPVIAPIEKAIRQMPANRAHHPFPARRATRRSCDQLSGRAKSPCSSARPRTRRRVEQWLLAPALAQGPRLCAGRRT